MPIAKQIIWEIQLMKDLLAFIEKRFVSSTGSPLHLTQRDANASTLEDLFDFKRSDPHQGSPQNRPSRLCRDQLCPSLRMG